MYAIETEELHKAFDEQPVLRGLTLRVPQGSVYGLVGPAGAGKTTLLHLLLGFLRRDAGALQVLGSADVERVRRQIGYLPQGQRYHGRFTPREYLYALGQFGGLPGARLGRRVAEELHAAGLESVADQPIEALARPMLERLGVAQALLSQPALLLLDEPAASDGPGSQSLLDLIAGLRERGQTILLATQRLELAELFCDRVGILAGGRLAAEAEPRALRGPGRNVLISVASLPAELAERLRAIGPAVLCEGDEIALQPNSPELQARVLGELLGAGVVVVALEPFGRPIEDLYARAVRGLPQEGPLPGAAPGVVPGRPGHGDTLLRELLKNEEQHNP
jgi:ABC-2 type transport system ATP-binding protein